MDWINKKELVKILKNKPKRKQLFAKSFELFCFFYFPKTFNFKSKDFHKEYIKQLKKKNKNVMFTGFRNCWKTVLAKYFIIWSICYKKYRYIEFYCYDKTKAKDRLFDVALQLQTNKKLLNDYWNLFYEQGGSSLKKSKKKRIWEFITTNQIKVQAKSIGMSPRWDVYGANDWEFRPDLAIFDDVDVIKSVKKTKTIDKNYSWFKNEVVWWLANQSKIVFLWNVIKEDGILPRLEKDYKNNDSRYIMKIKIYDDDWNIIRPERYCETKQEAKKINKNKKGDKKIKSIESLREDSWSTAFQQNYLLDPQKEWETIIKRSDITYWNIDKRWSIYFWIDPAFSEKTASDSMTLVITKHIQVNWEKYYYVLEAHEFKGREKNEKTFVKFVKQKYNKYKTKRVNIESNNWWEIIARMLQRKNVAVNIISPKNDKVTRLMEYQADIEMWLVKFHPTRCDDLVEQLLGMPNVEHDDLVDWFVYSLKGTNGELTFIK